MFHGFVVSCEVISFLYLYDSHTSSSGAWIDPSWFALDKSRGVETKTSKVYMRATVLACDTLVYVPAVVYFVRTWQKNRSSKTQVPLSHFA